LNLDSTHRKPQIFHTDEIHFFLMITGWNVVSRREIWKSHFQEGRVGKGGCV